MKKKAFRSVLLALLALSLLTSVVYAFTIKTVTVRIYKHKDVNTTDTTLKNYVKDAMYEIMVAVWHGSYESTQLFYALKGPSIHDDWDNDGSKPGDDTCKMDPDIDEGPAKHYAIYFLENKLPSSYAHYDGGYAVVNIDHVSTCPDYWDTDPLPTTVHELGHVFGARDRHNTTGWDVMDKYDARRGYYHFSGTSKYKIAQFVMSRSDEHLNDAFE